MKISIVVPIYGVAQYLQQCVESVLRQSYSNIELILVDDGSQDDSPRICDAFKTKDSRVIVIHKENGGLSDARNVGITHTTGAYIAFLDGDDFWDDLNALARLVSRLKVSQADVLNYSYKKFFEKTGECIPYIQDAKSMPMGLNKVEQMEYLTQNGLYIASACNKLIRKELLDAALLFEEGVYSEDIEWCARLLLRADSFDFMCENFYCYRQREDSIRHTISDKKCNDLKSNILKSVFLAQSVTEEWKEPMYRYVAFQYATFLKVQAQAENDQFSCIEQLKPYQWVLKHHGSNRKVRCLHFACKLIGLKNTCKLIRFLSSPKS